jgi:hypothetical protein
MGALLHDGAGRSDVDFRGLEKVVRKQRRVDLYKIRAEVKQSRALASDALALMDSEACSEAQSKARQDTQPAKQGVEHAQVSWQGPDSSQKINPTLQHFLNWSGRRQFLCWAEVSPSHLGRLAHQPAGATSCRRTVYGGDSVTKQSSS